MVPVTAPTRLGLPNLIHSMATQTQVAVAADRCVASMAMPASRAGVERAARIEAEPADPQQRSADHHHPGRVRRMDAMREIVTRPQHPGDHNGRKRRPSRCTTMPPAKSITPRAASQPPPHTQCATGA